MSLERAQSRRAWTLGLLGSLALFTMQAGPGAQASEPSAPHLHLPNLAARATDYVESSLTYTPTGPLELYLDPPHEPYVLRFNARAANAGAYPLELLGVPTSNALALRAHECVQWVDAVCTERVEVGQMEWHQAHQHWHFNDFALYELRRLGPDGAPDMSGAGLVGSGTKASFCLMDSERDAPGGSLVGRYQTCSGVLQGISPGWADFYGAGLPGQEISLEGVADGVYALVFTLDPDNRLHESDESDNQAWSVVELSNGGSQTRVVDQP